MATVRDKLWLWGHEAGSHDYLPDTPFPSRITPVEAAAWLNIPNVVMVRYNEKPAAPFDQYAVPFASLKGLVWSIIGNASAQGCDLEPVLQLAERYNNMSGVIMDDFFERKPDPDSPPELSPYTPEALAALRERLHEGGRNLDLWVVLYTHQLHLPIADHLRECDVVTLWTWHARDLKDLEANLARTRELCPESRIMLGCYMHDYGPKGLMPVARMEEQCETGLRWLRDGQIEGMIFLASCICDLGFPAVEWTRNWIQRVGDTAL